MSTTLSEPSDPREWRRISLPRMCMGGCGRSAHAHDEDVEDEEQEELVVPDAHAVVHLWAMTTTHSATADRQHMNDKHQQFHWFGLGMR